MAFTNLFDVLSPFALMRAIDAISNGDRGALRDAVLLYAGFTLLTVSFRNHWRINFGRFHHSVAEDLRNRLFNKLAVLGPRFFEKNPTGELMSLMINDVNTFRMAVGPALLILFDAGFIIAFVLPFMLSVSVEWTWKTMVLLPLIPFIIRFMEDRIAAAGRAQQDRLAEMSGFCQELVTGVRVVKGFAQEENKQTVFRRFSKRFADSCNDVARYDAMFEPALQIGVAAGAVILLAWGSRDVLNGAITLGTFVAFHEYIKRMTWPMAAIGSGLSLIQQGRASFDRIAAVLSAEPEVADSAAAAGDPTWHFESLEVRNLTYTYPDAAHPALNDVSFSLKKGEVLGILGPVGSGKSTLVQLLGRLRPTPENTVFVNGHPLESLRIEDWRARLTVVPQEAFLFSRTVEENVLFGSGHDTVAPNREKSEINRIAVETTAQVAIEQEIAKLPQGFRSWLGEKGINLSGGQRQRLTIARALAREFTQTGRLLILDDSLSAVDSQTEAQILRSFRGRAMTAIIVSHRLQALALADRVMVLNDGRIEAIGTHSELLLSSATYQRIYRRQNQDGPNGAAAIDPLLEGLSDGL